MHRDTEPTIKIARGFFTQSIIEHPFFLTETKWLQNKFFKENILQSIFIIVRVIWINNENQN